MQKIAVPVAAGLAVAVVVFLAGRVTGFAESQFASSLERKEMSTNPPFRGFATLPRQQRYIPGARR
jgi:hypothetical protein